MCMQETEVIKRTLPLYKVEGTAQVFTSRHEAIQYVLTHVITDMPEEDYSERERRNCALDYIKASGTVTKHIYDGEDM